MTLLQQIQNEAVDASGDVAPLLRRCRILAQRLAVDEFKSWVIWELEGYPTDEEPDLAELEGAIQRDKKAGADGMGEKVRLGLATW